MFPDSLQQSKISGSNRNQIRKLLSNSQIHRKLTRFNQAPVYLPAQYNFYAFLKKIYFIETRNLTNTETMPIFCNSHMHHLFFFFQVRVSLVPPSVILHLPQFR